MKRFACACVGLGLAVAMAAPAAAWDPEGDDPFDSPPIAGWVPEPAAVPPPAGIYLVTDTYAGDVVTRSGDLTTYSTETVHQTTGSYARVLETVATGDRSGFDGVAFNGRASLTDGRAVAGTFYQNYVRTDDGFVPVSVVFFQDDEEIARAARASRPAGPPPGPASAPPAVPAPVSVPGGPMPPPATAVAAAPIGSVAPTIDRTDRVPEAPSGPAAPPPAPLPDRSIEVLRGRRIAFSFDWPAVRAWRFVSGEVVALGPTSAAAGEPFVGRWDRLATPGGAWVVRFAVDLIDGTTRELALRVAVRAPGLTE